MFPQAAYLELADAVDPAEALFESVRVPGQVVVDHQVRPLEVEALTGGVGGNQDLAVEVLGELLGDPAPLPPPYAAMDGDDSSGAPEESADTVGQVPARASAIPMDTCPAALAPA
jgi:hypothetical protein